MPGQTDPPVQDESGDRYFDFRSLRVHNRHLQKGKLSSENCPMCESGLEGALHTAQEVAAGGGVLELVPGDGADGGRDSPSSPDYGDDPENENQLLGDKRGLRHTAFRPSVR